MTTFQPFRWETTSEDGVQIHRAHLPYGGHVDIAVGTDGPPGTRCTVGTYQSLPYLRIHIPEDPSMGTHYPYTGWFLVHNVRGVHKAKKLIDDAGGFVGGVPSVMWSYWETYARELEGVLKQATEYMESQEDDPDQYDVPTIQRSMRPDYSNNDW